MADDVAALNKARGLLAELAGRMDAATEGRGEVSETSEQKVTWTQETIAIINKMTPEIKGKSFDPDWFLLRQRFEAIEEERDAARARIAELEQALNKVATWLENNADKLEHDASILSRFPSLADNANADAKNFRGTAASIRKHLPRTSSVDCDCDSSPGPRTCTHT
jgi:DNA repair exonuclease SbcCD ATPase subunit